MAAITSASIWRSASRTNSWIVATVGLRWVEDEKDFSIAFDGLPTSILGPLPDDFVELSESYDAVTPCFALTYNFEASWRRGPFWVGSEYLIADVDAASVGNPNLHGFAVTGSWAITGEMRGYDRKRGVFSPLPVSRSVNQNGNGAWELAARWSELDATNAMLSGGETRILSLGLSWWLTPLMSFSFDYRWVNLDRDGLDGESTGLLTRLTLFLE